MAAGHVCRAFFLGVVLIVVTAGTLAAQTPTSRFFADGGFAADLDPFTYNYDAIDAQPAGFAAIGGSLPRRWSLRFEATWPAWHEHPYSYSYRSNSTTTVTESGMNRHRIATYSFLAGRDFEMGRRVTLTPLFGLGAADHADHEQSSVTTTRLADSVDKSRENSYSHLLTTISGGAELTIAVSRRFAVVPGVRLHLIPQFESALTMWRPGVAVRLRF